VVEAKRKPPEEIKKGLHHEVVPESLVSSVSSHLAPRRGAGILALTGGFRFASTTGYSLATLSGCIVALQA
jgi:hypothetical protein